jgi:dUTP pyrophosphatase
MRIKMIVTDERLHEFGLPSFATPGSAGIDLRAMIDAPSIAIQPGEVFKVSTGLRVYVQDPTYAAFALPRSGTGTKGLVLGNLIGLIDSDYQGPLSLALWNRSSLPIQVNRGDRVAQLVVVPVAQYQVDYVEDFGVETERGQGGYGSTGVK